MASNNFSRAADAFAMFTPCMLILLPASLRLLTLPLLVRAYFFLSITHFRVFAAPGMLRNLPPQSTAEQVLGAAIPREKHVAMLAAAALERAALLEKNLFLLGAS